MGYKKSTDSALEQIAVCINSMAFALRALGNGNSATEMGAIENLAKEIKDGSERISSSISELAEAFRNK